MANKVDITCPWCSQVNQVSEIRVERRKNEHGTIIERSCGKCGKVLAAYVEKEGDFLPKIKTFPNKV